MMTAMLWGAVAASALLVGFLLSGRGLSNRIVGLVTGFGCGALISAIAYELVPEADMVENAVQMSLWFAAGALVFFVGDELIERGGGAHRKHIAGAQPGGSGAAVFLGTLLDAVPESLILGMSLALGGTIEVAFLVAVFVSNLPEGLAGSVNLEAAGNSRRKVFWMWFALVGISAVCAGLGYLIITWMPSTDGRNAQAFAAGAMLTMLADVMMPEAYEHGGKLVGLLTAAGFLMTALLTFAG